MTVAGVPVLDLVLFVVMLGFGVEAYLTTRRGNDDDPRTEAPVPPSEPAAGTQRPSGTHSGT